MPSKVVTANTTAQSIAAERENATVKPTSMTLDNDGGAGDRVLRIQDVFTPSVSNGVSSPSQQTVDRFRVTAIQGDIITFNKDDLEGVKCLGAMQVVSDVTDANLHITVGYEHE